MRKIFLIVAEFLVASWLLLACILNTSSENTYLLSLQVPDILTQMDSVHVLILNPTMTDTIEVVWRDSLPSTDSLLHIHTKKYRGEEAYVDVEAYRGGARVYKILAHYFETGKPPEITHFITASKDASVDTNRTDTPNNGYTFAYILPSTQESSMYCVAFDWSSLDQARITSAVIHLNTYAYPEPWTSSNVSVNTIVFAMKGAWTEGTGNWYWNNGSWQNDGQVIFSNYPVSPDIAQTSTDPFSSPGVNPSQIDLFRRSNLDSVSSQTLSVQYATTSVAPIIPPPQELTSLDIDVTQYIKNTASDQAFGFVIMANGAPNGYNLSVVSKEIGDRTLGAELRVKY